MSQGLKSSSSGPTYLFYVTIGLVAFAVILFELLQTRILSFLLWGNLVYLSVSLALLGFGISGTFCCVFKSHLTKQRQVISWLLNGFAASSLFAVSLAAIQPFLALLPQMLQTSVCYLTFLLPFIFGSAIINLILSAKKLSIGRLYAVDLLAASVACFLFSFLLLQCGPILLTAFIAITCAVLSFFWDKTKATRLSSLVTITYAIILSACNLTFPEILFMSPGNNSGLKDSRAPLDPALDKDVKRGGDKIDPKEIIFSISRPGAHFERTAWTPLCRIDVIGSKKTTLLPWPAMCPEHAVPDSYKVITQDGTAYTGLFSKAADAATRRLITNDPLRWPDSARCAAYWSKTKPDVAVIGLGGGRDVVYALGYDANSVVAAEINPATFKFVTKDFADYSGHALEDPRIKLFNEEGRAMVRHIDRKVDILNIAGIDTFAAMNAGAYVLSESYLYTTEAMREFMSKLKPDGIIVFHRYTRFPPTEPIRLCSLACEAYKQQGFTDQDKRIVVMTEGAPTVNFTVTMFKNSPFTPAEVKQLASATKGIENRTVVYFPKVLPENEQTALEKDYYQGRDPLYLELGKKYSDLIMSYHNGSSKEFFAQYPYQIRPVSDDSPFFFSCDRAGFSGISDWFAEASARKTLMTVLIESLVLSAVAIIWPLLHHRRKGLKVPNAFSFGVYFACLGFGFMVLEICLVQKAVLFLGSPLYALSTVMATLLLGAGTGSYVQSRMPVATRKSILTFAIPLMLLLCALAFGMNHVIYSMLDQPLTIRMLITLLVIFPVGLCLGTFFPNGLAVIKDKYPQFIPWAWGINGCLSVVGSFASIAVSMAFGFTTCLLLAVATYATATFLALNFPPVGDRPSS